MNNALVFNGVNGATGEYGLPPMTSEQLAEHISGSTAQRVDVHQGLALGYDRTAKIAAIVRILAESSIEVGERNACWFEAWLDQLAAALAQMLLQQDVTGRTKLEALKERLRWHTVDKLVEIVDSLVRGKEKELAELLLMDQDEADDDRGMLGAKLKPDINRRFDELQADLRAAMIKQHLVRDGVLQNVWLDTLIARLRLVPVRAWNAFNRSSSAMQVRALDPLIRTLDKAAADGSLSSRWVETLRAGLKEIKAESPYASWDDVLDALHDGLRARPADQHEAGSWNALLTMLNRWIETTRMSSPLTDRMVKQGVDSQDLAQAGWGILFAHEDPRRPERVPGIKAALAPLIDLRRKQAGKRFSIYEGKDGYRYNDTADSFLIRHGAAASSPADPDRVPYYLLIVGSPDEIPFHFQYQLDVQYAVGRIDFGDDLDAYQSYARSVVDAEARDAASTPRATFFGPANPGDRSTRLSSEHLVGPLYERLKKRLSGWRFDAVLQDKATRARLLASMGGDETPDLLFVACHGVEFDQNDPQGRQVPYQGALLCQEWRGPGQGEVQRQTFLSGEDLDGEASMLGTIAFFFACYSAGTPRFDEFYKQAFKDSGRTIAHQPFVAALPKAMLKLSKGGALSVVGHVERVWSSSFLDAKDNEQCLVFESALEHLLKGYRIGSAMEYFNVRYAALSTELTAAFSYRAGRQEIDPYQLAAMWTANNDARGYVVIGDPAVRLSVKAGT
ncbi:MAG: hypothetical protein JXA89_20195 [Anaerolineae bacterium]|nr:hypothetical protein [Anaerolineae bacterium]